MNFIAKKFPRNSQVSLFEQLSGGKSLNMVGNVNMKTNFYRTLKTWNRNLVDRTSKLLNCRFGCLKVDHLLYSHVLYRWKNILLLIARNNI